MTRDAPVSWRPSQDGQPSFVDRPIDYQIVDLEFKPSDHSDLLFSLAAITGVTIQAGKILSYSQTEKPQVEQTMITNSPGSRYLAAFYIQLEMSAHL